MQDLEDLKSYLIEVNFASAIKDRLLDRYKNYLVRWSVGHVTKKTCTSKGGVFNATIS